MSYSFHPDRVRRGVQVKRTPQTRDEQGWPVNLLKNEQVFLLVPPRSRDLPLRWTLNEFRRELKLRTTSVPSKLKSPTSALYNSSFDKAFGAEDIVAERNWIEEQAPVNLSTVDEANESLWYTHEKSLAQERGVDTTRPQVRLFEIDGTITIRVPRYSAKEYNDMPRIAILFRDVGTRALNNVGVTDNVRDSNNGFGVQVRYQMRLT
ncbi:hypothetical protein B0H13DRAFT_1922519 [Mycena leptocephala]|nr:hypothetical protein B0H13DRAFT_1922519 [Mycena leptocephala]